jgi:hypothetical protein
MHILKNIRTTPNIKSCSYYTYIFFILFYFDINAQNNISIKEQVFDINEYVNVLNEKHIGLYRYNTKKEFKCFVDSILNTIRDSVTLDVFYKKISLINENIKCGHSKVDFPNKNLLEKSIFIPFSIYSVNSRYYILHDLSDSSCIGNHTELLSINNIKITDILTEIYKYIPSDGYIKTRKNVFSENVFPLYYALYFNQDSVYNIIINKKDDVGDTLSVKATNFNKLVEISKLRYPVINNKKIFLNKINDNNINYLKVSDLSIDTMIFEKIIDSIFFKINDSKINDLIIDLRGNNGGKISNEYYLLSHLIKKKTKTYIRREYINNNNKIIKSKPKRDILPHNNLFYGNIFILSDGYSFSATSELLSIIKYHKIGIIIGEESGGANEGCNYGNNKIRLKYSNIECVIPNHKSIFFKHTLPRGRGVMPDYNIIYTIYDMINNNDKAMYFTIKLINDKY